MGSEEKEAGATASSETFSMENFVSAMMQALNAQNTKDKEVKSKYIPKVPRNYALGHNFTAWLSQFHQYAKLANVPASEMKDVMMTLLDQPAYRAVQLLRLPDDILFDHFTAKLIERFDAKSPADYKLQLKTRKQHKSENYDDYSDALLEMTGNAYPTASTEFINELAKDRFIDGVMVADEIREKLYLNQPDSLAEAVKTVRSLESARINASHNIHKSAQHKKINCDAISAGNEKKSEMKELQELVVSLKTKIESLEERLEKKQSKKMSEVKCYACQNMGHYASSCPGKGKFSGNEGKG